MSIKILIDMNLSPEWVGVFEQQRWPATHWSAVGAPDADDALIMQWACMDTLFLPTISILVQFWQLHAQWGQVLFSCGRKIYCQIT